MYKRQSRKTSQKNIAEASSVNNQQHAITTQTTENDDADSSNMLNFIQKKQKKNDMDRSGTLEEEILNAY